MLFINARFITQPTTGVQRFAESIAAQLLEQRNDVTLLVPSGAQPRPDGPLAQAPVTAVGALSGHLWEQVDLPRHLQRLGNPLLLGLTNTNPIAYHNMISTHHDVTYLRYPESYSRAFRILYTTLSPHILRHSRRILTVSEFSRQDLASAYGLNPHKISVVHNATDFAFAPSVSSLAPPKGHDEYFLSVSSRNQHKNVARLVDAFAEFRRASGSKTRLLLVGDHSSVFSGRATAERRVDGVEYTGRVTDAELQRLLSQAKAFVFPSLYEGFGIPPIEAQAFAVPVLSSRAASLPEVLGDSALYFEPTDTGSITSALARIDEDANLRSLLADLGRTNVRRFSWTSSAAAVSAVVDALDSAG